MIGKLLDHRYRVIRVLAIGGFGQTYIAQDTKRPGNPICVVKHLKPSNSDPKVFETAKRLFNSEAETLEKLGSHDQIPRLLAYFDENHEFYLVQEFIEGHPLSDELAVGQNWTESQVIQMLQEILSILEFVHSQGVIHRDIKPDNIIRRDQDKKLVLVDFGAVKQLRSPNYKTGGQPTATVAIGTPGYMPTEQGQGKPRPNSDIYALGIIAIQALTGVSPMDLQEDQNTGEVIWQHLAPVSNDLAAILTIMVRYHFKDRYQSAGDALLRLRLLSSTSGQEYPKPVYQTSLSPESRQKTVAVSPANSVPAKPARKVSNGPDFMPLVVAALLAGGAAALVANVAPNVKNFNFKFASNDSATLKNCVAVVEGNSNIRSEPSSFNSDTIVETVANKTKYEVTGKRTKHGWVEVKLDNGSLAWTHKDVIANDQDWVSCLRDKNIAIKTVDDAGLIATQPAPIPKPKLAIDLGTKEPKLGVPSQSASPSETQETTASQNASVLLEQARKKYETGDLQGAIAQLRTIPQNASEIKNTVEVIAQWQQDWAKAEALSNDINKALDEGKWDKVLSYKEHPEKLPNIQFWRDKIDPLFKQAANNLAKQELPKVDKLLQKNDAKKQPNNKKP
jgi:serine/threonine protein kinase, bacterial